MRGPPFTGEIPIKSCLLFLSIPVWYAVACPRTLSSVSCSRRKHQFVRVHNCRRGTELLMWVLIGRLPAPSSCCCCLLLALAADSASAVAACFSVLLLTMCSVPRLFDVVWQLLWALCSLFLKKSKCGSSIYYNHSIWKPSFWFEFLGLPASRSCCWPSAVSFNLPSILSAGFQTKTNILAAVD